MLQITNDMVVEYNTNVTIGSSSKTYIMLKGWEFSPLMIFWAPWLSKDLESFLIIFCHNILQLKFQPKYSLVRMLQWMYYCAEVVRGYPSNNIYYSWTFFISVGRCL